MSRRNSDATLKASGTIATKANDNAVVDLAGAETVSTTETFSTSAVVPAPTAGDRATAKPYVDMAASGGTPKAISGVKGKPQLARDLSGPASAPTLPAVRIERC